MRPERLSGYRKKPLENLRAFPLPITSPKFPKLVRGSPLTFVHAYPSAGDY